MSKGRPQSAAFTPADGHTRISAIIQTEPGEMAEWLKAAVC
jgi:hypothetical protein